MSIYYGDSSGKARKIALTGIPGPQGPAGQGVPAGGAAEQMLVKKK